MLRICGDDPGDSLRRSGGAVALGVFDGVHLGHAAVLRRVIGLARELGGSAVGLTFAPHPLAVLAGEAPPALCGLARRLDRMAALGLDAAWVLPFTEALAREPAEDFAARVLRDALGARAVVCGHTARFGRERLGDGRKLAEWGADWGGWRAETVGPARAPAGGAVSSSAIRAAIGEGRLDEAAAMLGRRYSLRGAIVRGRQLARRLGCPTVNLDVPEAAKPSAGVYAAHLRIDRPDAADPASPPVFAGAALLNIGPYRGGGAAERADDRRNWLVEAHALDAAPPEAGDWYGLEAEVFPLRFLRPPARFKDEDEARARIADDLRASRLWRERHPFFDPAAVPHPPTEGTNR